MRSEYTPFDYMPHVILARYYAQDFLAQRQELPAAPHRPSRLGAAAKRLAARLFGGRPVAEPQLQGCG